MNISYEVKKIISRYIGPLGELFLRKQCDTIKADPNNLTPEDLKKLISLVEENSVLLCGKGKASEMKRALEDLLLNITKGGG